LGDEYTYVGDDKLYRHNPLHDMTKMTRTDMYKPEMNSSNGSTTDTRHMTMTTTIDMRKPDKNGSKSSSDELMPPMSSELPVVLEVEPCQGFSEQLQLVKAVIIGNTGGSCAFAYLER